MSKKNNGLPEMNFSILDVPGNAPPAAPVHETAALQPAPPAPTENISNIATLKKTAKETITETKWKQRGLHLSDDVVIRLRISAMRKGISASKLADQILRKHLPALADIVAA